MKLQVVVPTLGRSPVLAGVLAALGVQRDLAGGRIEILLVRQGPAPVPAGADREITVPSPVGFSAAVNLGMAAGDSPYVGTVNDDAVVEPGWAAALLEALEADVRLAAVQGVNRIAGHPELADGWGLAWNRSLQAVQLGHGRPALPPSAEPREVFGVSATAAVYRRAALALVARPPRRTGGPPEVFDERLGSYYEDVELAGRLRVAGFSARSIPAAQAVHAGASTLGGRRWRLVYGNRYRVAAELLGSTFWRRLPGMAVRDLRDFARLVLHGELAGVAGVLGGWSRAVATLPPHLRVGPPAVALSELSLGLEDSP